MLFDLEPPFYVGYLLAASVPLLLVASFLVRGKPQRHRYLTSATPSRHPASLLAPPAEIRTADQTLGEYLGERYTEAQAARNYVVPLALFWVVWAFGWYWSLVGLSIVLRPSDPRWTSHPLTLAFAPIPAAAFVGSAAIVLMYLTARAIRGDLQPKAFTHFAARLLVGTILAWATASLAGVAADSPKAKLLVALGGGLFPSSALLVIERTWRRIVGLGASATPVLPLRSLQGIGDDEELRLWEEGVSDAEHMATESLIDLVVNTHYSIERLIDWKDQAFLYIYAPNEFDKWRSLGCRSAMDVLGLEAHYFGKERHDQIVPALAKGLGKEVPVIERIIDTIYNDPRVHQLWNYLVAAYPASPARPITAPAPAPDGQSETRRT